MFNKLQTLYNALVIGHTEHHLEVLIDDVNAHTFFFKDNIYCINGECIRLNPVTMRSLYKHLTNK